MKKTKFNQNLLFKIFLAVLLSTVLVLAIVGVYSYSFTRGALQNSIMENDLEIIQQTMDKIDRMLYERYLNIQEISGEDAFASHLADNDYSGGVVDEYKKTNNLRRMKELAIVT